MIAAAAAAISLHAFRYERVVRPAGADVVEIVPDGPLYAHTRDFADLRVVDAAGAQVPWATRQLPPLADSDVVLDVLDSGRRGALAVARVRTPAPVDRVQLVVPDKRFVGVGTVYGSDDRATWTRIGSTQIYSVGGAKPARSTDILLRPNDFRYLEVRATSVTRINRVVVRESHPADLVRVPAKTTVRGGTVVVDVGYPNVPVDELRITSTTERYDRPFTITSHRQLVGSGRLLRLRGPGVTIAKVGATGRYIRVAVQNGDDPPLRGVHVTAWARRRTLLVEGGHPAPLTLYYGNMHIGPPNYDFGRLPVQGAVRRTALGPEQPNPDYRVLDRRSFFAKHRSLVTVALALAAALLVAAGAFALRRT